MNCRMLFLLIASVAVGCGSTSGGTGGSGGSSEVTIETFNLALAGAFIPYEQQRRELLPTAIADSDADILCLQEVWTQADKELIRDAAAANFPNSVIFTDDLNTELNDATDQNGNVPPEPMTVPCPEGSAQDDMNAVIDCVAAKCNTIAPDDENGQTTSIACAIDNCVALVAGLFGEPRCYACLATQLPTSTFGQIRSTCPTVVNQVLAFEGQNGVMILSRYPLKDEANWVIPGTWNQRVIVSATAELPGGKELDIYCNHLTPKFDSLAFPYTGQYGNGETDAAGWEAEQLLQAQKLINRVETISGETPAAILGDLNTGHAFPPDIAAEAEPTLDLLETVFVPAYTADYAPECTFCTSNPVGDAGPDDVSVWIDHILLYNLPAESVIATKRTFDENVVPVQGGAGGAGGMGGAGGTGGAGGNGGAGGAGGTGGAGEMLVPLSDHFGMQSVILVP